MSTTMTPPARPPLDPTDTTPRWDDERVNYGWSPAAELAVRNCEANRLADRIHHAAGDLFELAGQWLGQFGADPDPGLTVIRAAGLAVDGRVEKYGTELRHVREHLAGLRWSLEAFSDLTRDYIRDPDQEPGAAGQEEGAVGGGAAA